MTDALAQLAHKAVTLDERVARAKRNADGEHSIGLPDELQPLRLFWAEALGSESALLQRLSWDQLDESALRAILDDLPNGQDDLPEWLEFLRKALEQFGSGSTCATDATVMPFGEVWSAFANVATSRLRASARFRAAASQGFSLTEECWTEIHGFFARRLAPLGAAALFADFAVYRQAHDPAAESEQTYADWMSRLRHGGAADLFLRYPVLARSLATLSLDAVSALEEWWERLVEDWPELRLYFGLRDETCSITALRLGLSDRHYHGRQALRFELSGTTRLIYKPKSVGLDAAFASLLTALRAEKNAAGDLPMPVRTMARSDYGWSECVVHEEFLSASEVSGYYRRCGGLLAVVYALEGRDFTMDNLVATRAGPAAIDAEALMQPLCRPAGSENVHGEDLAALTDRILRERDFSVLDTGMLPGWQESAKGKDAFFDVSGIAGQSGYTAGVQADEWTNAGTTRMNVIRRPVSVPPELNSVSLAGQPCPAGEYVRSIIDGFAAVWRLLMRLRDAPAGWLLPMLQSWEKTPVRLLLRPTGIYGRTLQRMLKPAHLSHPLLAGALAEQLWKPFLRPGLIPAIRPFLREEAESLGRLDIPCFHLPAQGDTRPFFLVSPLEMGLRRLKSLTEAGLEVQQRIIRVSFALPPRRKPATFDRTVALNEALEIAKMMEMFDSEGSCNPSPSGEFGTESSAVGGSHVRTFLYDGDLAGRCLFFSALSQISEDRSHLERALRGLEELWLATGDNASFRADAATLPIGAATGICSMVYTFLTASRLLGVDSWRVRALEIARLLSREAIAADPHFDILCGAAGAAMVLASAATADDPQGTFRERAIWCGEHLLAHAHTVEGHAGRWWRGTLGEWYLGYGHGVAGIAAALARLSGLTGDARFSAVADEAFSSLDTLFHEDKGMWPVLVRDHGDSVFKNMESLCHGSAGIALGAIEGGQRGRDTARITSRAFHVLATTRLHPVDTLCCGNMGRVEGWLALPDEKGHSAATELMKQCLSRLEACGIYRTSLKRSEQWTLPKSFFRGLSGIGYTLLRTAWPAEIPSVAQWK